MSSTVVVNSKHTVKMSDLADVHNASMRALVDGGTISGSPVHYAASETTVVLADATDLASALALANHVRDVYTGDPVNRLLGHINDALVHKVIDGVNLTTSPKGATVDADAGLAKSVTLIEEIATDYTAHRSQAGVHANNDGGNALAALSGYSKGTILFDTKANHADGDLVTVDDGNGHSKVFEIEKTTASTATITFDTVANLGNTDTITINDGTNPPVVFELDKAGDGVVGGRVAVDVSGDTTAAQVGARFKTALDAQIGSGALALTDSINGGTGVITVTATLLGTGGNITLSKSSSSALAVVNNAGSGVAGVTSGHVSVSIGSDTTAAQVAARFKTALDLQTVGGGGTLQLSTGISTATITVTSTQPGKTVALSKVSSSALAVTITYTALAALVARVNDVKAKIIAHIAAASTMTLLRVVDL